MDFHYYTAATLNGFLADEADSLQWLFDVPGAAETEKGAGQFLAGISTLVMGSHTYEWLLREMDLLDNPGAWPYGGQKTFVFSSRDLPVPEGVDIEVVNGPVQSVIPEMTGEVWIIGGGDLAGQFLDAGALTTITLTLAPAFLATGKPLLPRNLFSDRLELTGATKKGQFVELAFDVTG
ncbi:dihydrofolate reductase family protein [Corynebacterium guangdongense]|uniref:Dihydrofolate reductase n=1 Tax=Corynebacterium guangdongense TaxID=1783348 RepID=A0ABU1ZZ84_9CORY|nr:dihydrofolate reductase family protein [Corynebacterium guangdongense]MDR7330240.1 dihydrofolate reductase [Corynebacterium guangdongense]WJZ18798.1 hypothetical protein CGUA_11305 [Corynebacterium guangdongense]